MPCTSLSLKYDDAPFSCLLFPVRDRSQIGWRTVMAGGGKGLPTLTLASLWLFTEALRQRASDSKGDAQLAPRRQRWRALSLPWLDFFFLPKLALVTFICSASQSLDADYRWDFFFSHSRHFKHSFQRKKTLCKRTAPLKLNFFFVCSLWEPKCSSGSFFPISPPFPLKA